MVCSAVRHDRDACSGLATWWRHRTKVIQGQTWLSNRRKVHCSPTLKTSRYIAVYDRTDRHSTKFNIQHFLAFQ